MRGCDHTSMEFQTGTQPTASPFSFRKNRKKSEWIYFAIWGGALVEWRADLRAYLVKAGKQYRL